LATFFEAGVATGIAAPELEEASGLVASAANPGLLWTHNDSGNPADLFLIDSTGAIKLTCHLLGVKNRDWEDITRGPGPDSTRTYLYVGEIGDNEAKYSTKIIYRLPEPVWYGERETDLMEVDAFHLLLPDGRRDTETLFHDPLRNEMFIVSKREDSVRLYQIPFPLSADTVMAERKLVLPIYKMVAADVSPDGLEILAKDYEHVYYWPRAPHESVLEAMQKEAYCLPYTRENQGESIAFSIYGNGYYTLGESALNDRAKVIFYKRGMPKGAR